MKYLTAPYLTLMHTFYDRASNCLNNLSSHLNSISIMQDYCTLRIDGGRQTGKTEAVSMFAREWLNSGGQVIILSINQSYANTTRARIGINKDVFCWTIRGFLSDSCADRYRGLSLPKPLIIIDEPCFKMPEIYKFYKAFDDHFSVCNSKSEGSQLPIFFVLGTQ